MKLEDAAAVISHLTTFKIEDPKGLEVLRDIAQDLIKVRLADIIGRYGTLRKEAISQIARIAAVVDPSLLADVRYGYRFN